MCVEGFGLRRRAAHHEAAHAVMAVVWDYRHMESFLTKTTRLDGKVGGWTEWGNPLNPAINPTPQAFADNAAQVVMVLYAGQYAERVLSRRCPLVRVPKREPNWDHDDTEADLILRVPPLSHTADAQQQLRDGTMTEVGRMWLVISRVAKLLLEPPEPGVRSVYSTHIPCGRALRYGEVPAMVRAWRDEGEPPARRLPWAA
jgi:hypothetical protein